VLETNAKLKQEMECLEIIIGAELHKANHYGLEELHIAGTRGGREYYVFDSENYEYQGVYLDVIDMKYYYNNEYYPNSVYLRVSVYCGHNNKKYYVATAHDGKKAILDSKGKLRIAPEYYFLEPLSDTFHFWSYKNSERDKLVGCVDINNNLILKQEFLWFRSLLETSLIAYNRDNEPEYLVCPGGVISYKDITGADWITEDYVKITRDTSYWFDRSWAVMNAHTLERTEFKYKYYITEEVKDTVWRLVTVDDQEEYVELNKDGIAVADYWV